MNDASMLKGRCTCGDVAIELCAPPMFVHCCYCSWCQRQTGSAFAVNALIEADNVRVAAGEPKSVLVPSPSGKGQKINRCPGCGTALWSTYAGMGEAIAFVRVGALEEPALCPPDIHIFTASKLPWVELPAGVPACEGYYSMSEQWPEESIRRFKAAREAT